MKYLYSYASKIQEAYRGTLFDTEEFFENVIDFYMKRQYKNKQIKKESSKIGTFQIWRVPLFCLGTTFDVLIVSMFFLHNNQSLLSLVIKYDR